eukprot:403359660
MLPTTPEKWSTHLINQKQQAIKRILIPSRQKELQTNSKPNSEDSWSSNSSQQQSKLVRDFSSYLTKIKMALSTFMSLQKASLIYFIQVYKKNKALCLRSMISTMMGIQTKKMLEQYFLICHQVKQIRTKKQTVLFHQIESKDIILF